MPAREGAPTLTVLTTHGPLLTKKHRPEGKVGYDKAARFEMRPEPIGRLEELHSLLDRLAGEPLSALVMEVPEPSTPNRGGRRRKRFFDPTRRWLALDIDTAEAPPGVSPVSSEAVEYVLAQLPEPLSGVSCIAQFTSSAGLVGQQIRVRVWFRLDGPMEASRLRAWAIAHNRKPGVLQIDEALFNAVQLHYTAAPVFDRVPDPFAARARLLPIRYGDRETVAVAALEAEIVDYEAAIGATGEKGSDRVSGGLAAFWSPPVGGWTGKPTDYLRDEPEGLGLHAAVNRLVWEAAQVLGPSPPPEQLSTLADRIQRAALRNAESGLLTGRDADYIRSETSVEAISRSFTGAVAKGAALRTPDGAATGFDAAIRDARDAAGGKPRSAGFTAHEYQHHAVRLGLSRLGPLSPDELLRLVEAQTGIKPLPATREMVRTFYGEQVDTYHRDHRLQSPHYDVHRIESLDEVEIEPGGITCLKAPHGSGKTKTIGAKAIADEAWCGGMVLLTHRRSLEASNSTRLGLASYRLRGDRLKQAAGVVPLTSTVIDSAASRDELARALHEADIILIDEAEQVFRHLAGETTKHRTARLLPVLRESLARRGKTVVLMDAGLDERTILGWQALAGGKPLRVYELPPKPRGKLHLQREPTRKNATAAALAEAVEALQRGERVVIAVDTRKGAQKLAEALTGRGYAGGLITGSSKDEATKQAFSEAPDRYPQQQGWQFLVYSPAIAAGVSLESGYFDVVVGLYTGVVSPPDFLQMLFRVRTVNEYSVAVVAQGHPSPVPLRARREALEGLAGEGIDDVSTFLMRIEEQETRDRQAHGIKFVAAAKREGLTIERIGGDRDLDPLAVELREIAEAIRECTIAEVLEAPVLDPAEAASLKQRRQQGETLAPAESLALDRAQVCELVGVEEPAALTQADVEFVKNSRNVREVLDIYALSVALMLDPGRKVPSGFNDLGLRPLVLRRYLLPKARMFAELMRGLSVDPITGAGSWTLRVAAKALATVAAEHGEILTTMGFRTERWGCRVAETVRSLIARLNLRVKTSGPRRARVYEVTADSWRQMLTYVIRTERLAEVEGANWIFDQILVSAEEEEDMLDSLPDWIHETLRRVRVVIANRKWLIETLGASRATASRRKRELAEIDAPGIRWFSASTDAGCSIKGITEIADLDRLLPAVSRALGAGLVRLEWIESLEGEGAQNGHLRRKSISISVASDQNEPPVSTPPTEPAGQRQPEPPPATRALGLAQIIELHRLAPVRQRMARKRGERDRRSLLRSNPSPSLWRWLNPATTEERILIELALGLNDGNPLRAQDWIRETAAMLRAA